MHRQQHDVSHAYLSYHNSIQIFYVEKAGIILHVSGPTEPSRVHVTNLTTISPQAINRSLERIYVAWQVIYTCTLCDSNENPRIPSDKNLIWFKWKFTYPKWQELNMIPMEIHVSQVTRTWFQWKSEYPKWQSKKYLCPVIYFVLIYFCTGDLVR